MATAADRLRVTQKIRDTRERVFEAFSDAELARQWAPNGCEMVAFDAGMRVGGTLREQMRCDGKTYTAHGVYKEIVPGKRVVFTHQWEDDDPVETLVTVEFEDKGGGTEVVLTQTGFREAAEAKAHEEGWSSALANFATLVEDGGKRRAKKAAG